MRLNKVLLLLKDPFDETLRPDPINYYDIKAMMASTTTEVLVAVVGEEVIASAYIDIRIAQPYLQHTYFGYLGFMFVKPEYRGMGVNKKIMVELKAWAKTKDITELRLDVYNDNHSAIRAYEKAGFQKHLINMRIEIQ